MPIRQVPNSASTTPAWFDPARTVVERAALDGVFPCAAALARYRGESATALAGSPEPGEAPLRMDALFDLASLTKPLATTLLVLRALESGSLDLDDPLERMLPQAMGGRLGATISDLLSHQAGLPPIPALQAYFPNSVSIDRDTAIAHLLAIPCAKPPRQEVDYSCTGFLLLGLVLERIGGQRLSALFDREIAGPLGLSPPVAGSPAGAARGRRSGIATFKPSTELGTRSVPTEYCAWRGRRIRGEVHDESSFCLGGDGGNAGLFADLAGVAKLFGVYKHGGGLLKPESVAAARLLRTSGLARLRGLGLQLHDAETCDGPRWPADSYGHTGFTGTSAWHSPSLGLTAIVLSNRVYHGRDSTAEKITEFRLAFHGALVERES